MDQEVVHVSTRAVTLADYPVATLRGLTCSCLFPGPQDLLDAHLLEDRAMSQDSASQDPSK